MDSCVNRKGLMLAAAALTGVSVAVFLLNTSTLQPGPASSTAVAVVAMPPAKSFFADIPARPSVILPKKNRQDAADEACEDCHPEATESFRQTGMGRSLYAVSTAQKVENFEPKAATIDHRPSGLQYRAYVDADGRWWQEESLPGTDYRRAVEAKYVIGSGNNTRSYLGWVENKLIELPLTWYVKSKIWDMSPGYEQTNKRFEREVNAKCLFCHNNLTPTLLGRQAQFERPLAEGISCNRCHGDGQAHVDARLAGKPYDKTRSKEILNPKDLSGSDQNKLCGQCHLQGLSRVLTAGNRWDAYDPRQPLSDYVKIFVHSVNDGPAFGIASHGARLNESQCAKIGLATCNHCHNPHANDRTRSRKDACLGCHQDSKGCTNEHSQTKDCASCHMHRGETSDIPHVNFTDHFIRKKPNAYVPPSAEQSAEIINAFSAPESDNDPIYKSLAHYNAWKMGSDDYQEQHKVLARDALDELILNGQKAPRVLAALGHLESNEKPTAEAIRLLKDAVDAEPDDLTYRLRLGLTLQASQRLLEAEDVFKELLRKDPANRPAWVNLGGVLAKLGQYQAADAAFERADQINPFVAVTALNRGRNAAAQDKLRTARTWYQESIKRDPLFLVGHLSLALLDFDLRRFGNARRVINKALKVDKKYAAAYWLLGRIAIEERDYTNAEQAFLDFKKYQPDSPDPYLELGALYAQTQRVRQGIAVLNEGKKALGNLARLNQLLRRLNSMPKRRVLPDMGFTVE